MFFPWESEQFLFAWLVLLFTSWFATLIIMKCKTLQRMSMHLTVDGRALISQCLATGQL